MDLNKNINININNNNKLNYFFGNAGTGKFYNCTNSILNRQDNNLKSVLIIPEQFTMQAEKQLIDNSKNNIIFNTQVLNFKRLAHRIFEEMGIPKEKPLEDIGQVMVIRKILYTLDTQNNLYYFSENSYNNIGLLEKLVAILKEFFQFEVSVDMLVDAINSLNGIADVSESVDDKIQEKINDNIINNINIQDIDNSSSGNINQNLILKLTDLKNIYSLYKEYLEKEYITDDSILELLLKTIDHSNIIDSQTHVFVYGFEEFNSQELNILYKLFEKSQQVNIYFTLNTSETYYNDIDIFDPYSCIKQTINKIQDQILTPLAISVSSTYLDTNFRHKNNPELKHLEENFFKYKPSTYNSIPQNIKITSARNKYIEIENVAQQIFNLVKNEDYKFGDMTIILGDNSYANPLKMIFNKYNIPYFLDDKKPIINHSLVELIISSLEIILYNFQYEHIFRYLKSSYFDTLKINGLTKENINLLENYALKYQIKGFRWQQDFTYGSNSEFINSLRKSFLSTMSKLDIKKTKKYTSLEICTKIIDFIIDIKVKETIDIIIKREEDLFDKNIIKNTGNLDEHIQVFNSIGEILQKFVDIMGEDELTLEEFLKILKSGFEKETISIIPPKQDQILIGNFDRTKITNNKVIFLLAMNNGFVPAYKEESPFISDLEKVILRNNGIEMRNSSTTMLVTDMLKIYSLMLKPLDKIYLSYAISNLDGGVKNPSMVIDKVKDIFPKLKDKGVEQENKIDFIKLDLYSTHEIIFDNLFKNFDLFNTIKENLELQDVLKWFLDDDVDDNIDYEYGQKLTQIKESIEKLESNNDNFITKENLEYMYNNNKLFSSVSKLEEFNKCPFSYFLKYNINLRERDVDLLNNLKLGNLYHEILEKFSIEVFNNTSEFDDWKVLNKKDIYDKLDKIVNDMYKTDNINNILKSSPKYNYFFNRIKKITAISVEALIKQLKYGEFKPTDFEVNFEDIEENSVLFNNIKILLDTIILDKNVEMILKGKIDRVDNLVLEDTEYIKIIDYKSSKKTINLTEVYYGIQIQLLMYLSTVIKIKNDTTSNNIKPAGAFYFQVHESILDDSEKIKDFYKNFDIKGFLSEDKEVLEGLDTSKKDNTKSSKAIVGVSGTKKITDEQLAQLLTLSNIITKELGEEIVSGNIKVQPYKFDKKSGCEYCDFKAICHFDLIEKGSKYKYLNKINDKDIWEKINNKLAEYDGNNDEDENEDDDNINIDDKTNND